MRRRRSRALLAPGAAASAAIAARGAARGTLGVLPAGLLALGASAVLFLYMCDESAPVKVKMLHASTKGPLLTSLAAQGFQVDKSIEGVEAAELSDEELTSQMYPQDAAAAAAPTITAKAAPRGGRKLVKRTKPVDVE